MDGDQDPLTYSWEILSGAGVVSDPTEEVASVAVSALPVNIGIPGTETVEVQLTVVDCLGAVSTDTVILELECMGI